jgi:hypothetical protein
MTDPGAIAFQDDADEYVDQVTDDLLGGSGPSEGQDQGEGQTNGQGQGQGQGLGPNQGPDQGDGQDSGDSSSPPNFWLGPINVGPVTSGRPVDDPVTSGSDAVDTGPKGTVDNPGNSK